MSYAVKAVSDGRPVLESAETAKEAVAKAIDWQVGRQCEDVTISDGNKDYSFAEFSAAMAHSEIVATWQDS